MAITYNETLAEEIAKRIEEEIVLNSADLGGGSAETYAEYRFGVGKNFGFRRAIEIIAEAEHHIKNR